MTFLEEMKYKHCGRQELGCNYDITTCPVVSAVRNFNHKYPDKSIQWCPKCDGLFYGIKKSGKGKEYADYTGGLIMVNGVTQRTRTYRFCYACDCECGEVRRRCKVAPYIFTDNSNDCFAVYDRKLLDNRRKLNGEKKGVKVTTKETTKTLSLIDMVKQQFNGEEIK